MLVLCDSGILLRLFEPTDLLHLTVRSAVEALQVRGDKLVTAPQNAAEFWNVCTRPATARGGFGLDTAEAERRLQAVERTFSLLTEPPTAYALWRALVVTHSVQGKQVHDARLAALMAAHGITHILTLNGPDFARFPAITVLDPATVALPPAGTP
ncbi:MAG: PIN domain-containing protein [Zavarzinella sp.]|nr:PIN domain-containing protein [Zavarzinella sp.]